MENQEKGNAFKDENYSYKGESSPDDIELKRLSDEVLDDVGQEVYSKFQDCVDFMSRLSCKGKPLYDVIDACYDQVNGIPGEVVSRVQEEFGVHMYVNKTEFKLTTVIAQILKMYEDSNQLEMSVKPSPQPELSDAAAARVSMLFAEEYDGLIFDMSVSNDDPETVISYFAEAMADKQREIAMEVAEAAARRMQEVLRDQTFHGGYKEALIEFIRLFCSYPFAGFLGPIPTKQMTEEWVGGKLKQKETLVMRYYALGPKDVFWTPDSTTPRDGTAVYARRRMMSRELHKCKGMEGYIDSSIDKLIDAIFVNGGVLRDEYVVGDWVLDSNWVNYMIHAQQNGATMSTSVQEQGTRPTEDGSIDVVTRYGILNGHELIALGVKPKKKGFKFQEFEQYETVISFVGPYVLRVSVADVSSSNYRPVQVSSFEKQSGTMVGTCIPVKIHDLERFYNVTYILAAYNNAMVAAPVFFANVDKLKETLGISRMEGSDDQLDDASMISQLIRPGSVIPYNNAYDPISQGAPIQATQLPSALGQMMQLLQSISQSIDEVSGIPVGMQGEPTSRTAHRTEVMMMTNALAPIRVAFTNIVDDVIVPMTHTQYTWNMHWHKDPALRNGDTVIDASILHNAVADEIKRQKALEDIQAIGSGGLDVNDPSVASVQQAAAKTLLEGSEGYTQNPLDKKKAEMEQQQQQQMMMQQQMMQQQMAGGGAPQGQPPM